MRAPSLFGAAFVVLCGGCIYATGVQDYKVDDNSNVVVGGDDGACFADPNFATCESCCGAHHPAEKKATADQVQACACQPGVCQSECAPDFCVNDLGFFSTACDNCIKAAISSGTCTIDSSNAYNVCIAQCPQN